MVQSKLPETQGSLFWEMRRLALEKNAIDMSVGMTEFECHPRLAELAAGFIKEGVSNYAPLEGIMSLRERISELTERLYGRSYSPKTEITICAGHVQAISTAISSVVNEGDEVIVFEPAYFTYAPAVRLNGGMPVFVPLKEPGFKVDWEDLRKMINSKTRLIILNSPHNPTGSVFGKEDLAQLQRLTNGTGIYIVSDEMFEHLVFDEQKHLSMAQFDSLAARSFVVSSPGPLFHINGWGLAWCLAPAPLMAEFRKIHEHQIYNVNTPFQQALARFLEQPALPEEITEFYQGKRNYFNRLLKGSPFSLQPTEGTYFQLVGYQQLSNEPDYQFALRLLNEAGVAATPLSVFMHKKNLQYLRFCFAKKNETLDEVARRLIAFAEKNRL
ncbi:MAG TPA: methionine aminotransferase [Prolixibacteraceae bacterium]|nr:methionine aminotransferase [Prolixibacteraceae bacterium]